MKTRLSPTQKDLLILAKEKGHLVLRDFAIAYSSLTARKENLDRFMLLNILKETETIGKFEYIGGEND